MSAYGWIITENLIDNNVGILGPIDVNTEIQIFLKKNKGEEFRLLDDDNTVYYYGRIIGGTGFEPLDDYGAPNAGCTIIQYKRNGKWETL